MLRRRMRLYDAVPRSHYPFWITSRLPRVSGAIVRHRVSCCDEKQRPVHDATSLRVFELLSYLFGPNEIARVLRFCCAGIP